MEIEDGLTSAEASFQKTNAVQASDTEKRCLREFCTLSLQKRKLSGQNDERKEQRDKIKKSRTFVTDYMAKSNLQCLCLSKQQFKDAEKITAEQDVTMVPMYVRMFRNNKDSTITEEVIEAAIDDVTPELIKEAGSFVEAVMANVRTSIRTYTQQLRLSDSRERNQHVYETQEIPENLFQMVLDLHIQTEKLGQLVKANKETITEVSSSINHLKSIVGQFFDRTGILTQRVNLEGSMFRISKKVSVRHEKMTLSKLETMISKGPTDTSSLKRYIKEKLADMPPVTKSDIVFTAIK